MANNCTGGIPSSFDAGWRTQQNIKKSYVEELLGDLEDRMEDITDELAVYGRTKDFTPGTMPTINPTYPTFTDITNLRPQPINVEPGTVTLEERPDFLDIDEVPPDNIPAYTITDYVPDFPDAPPDDTPTFTEDAPVLADVEKPLKPSYTMPSDPVLFYPTIPDVPVFVFHEFDAELEPFNFVEPSTIVNPGQLRYATTLNDAIEASLENTVRNGGTGLADDVEDAIWRREEERALIAHYEAMDQIADEFGRRGFVLPPQMLTGALMVEKTNYVNKRLDTSRDIAIKQAELAQTNSHFAIEQGNTHENMMITAWNAINQRVFEASKAMVGYDVEIYRANIERYNVLVNTYKVQADVWKTSIDGEVAKIQGYLAQIEGAKATVEISKLNVDVYSAKIEAIKSLIQMYATEMEAAKVSADIEMLKLQKYKYQIDAYVAQINAVTAKFNLYTTEVDAEKARIGAWVAQIDGFKARVDAAKAEIDAHTARIAAQADTNKSLAMVYGADVDAFKSLVSQDMARMESEVKVYEGQVKGYEADARAYEAMGSLDIKLIDTKIEELKVESSIQIEWLKIDSASFLDYWKTRLGIFETEAQVYAQVAAAAMNSEATTTHFSESFSYGESSQTSCIDQHYYEETVV